MTVSLGFFNRPWNTLTVEESLDAIKDTGARHAGLLMAPDGPCVAWDTPVSKIQELKRALADRGLQLHTVLARVDFSLPVEESISRYKAFIDRAKLLEVPYLLEMGAHDPATYDRYFEIMRGVADHAESNGMTICLKPHGGLSTTGAQCAEAVQRVDHDAFKLWYDPGNIMYYQGLDPVAEAEHVKGMVVGMCVKDCTRTADGKPSVAVTPGEGEVDFEGVFRVLMEGGFASGPCLVETLGPSEPEAATEAGKQALQYLHTVLDKVGLSYD